MGPVTRTSRGVPLGIGGIAVLMAIGAVPAAAGPADLIGLDARDVGQAVPVATADSPAGAILGAPARLRRLRAQFSASVVASGAGVLVRRGDRPAGYEIDSSIYGARANDPAVRLSALATADLPASTPYTNLDEEAMLVVSSVHHVARWASVGVMVALPIGATIAPTTFYADEREAYFSNQIHLALLEDDRNGAVIAFGGAMSFGPRWDVGLGAQLIVGAAPQASVYVPNALEPAINNSNTTVGVAPALMPLASLRFALTPWLALSASLRLRAAQRIEGTTEIRLWAPGDSPLARSTQSLTYTIDTQPLRAVLGAEATHGAVRGAIEGVFRRGADYRDQHGQSPRIAFKNSWEAGAHATLTLPAALAATAGARYVTSPVPAQSGRENHADADRVILGAGLTRTMAKGRVTAALGVQAHRLRHRHERKEFAALLDEYPDSVDIQNLPIEASQGLQSNNPGLGGYTVGGWIGAIALTISVTQ